VTTDRELISAVLFLATGTLALRLTGPLLRTRLEFTARLQALIAMSVAVLFCALITTSALLGPDGFAGIARPTAVAVAGALAYKRAPFVVVVLAAAATAATLRLLGLP
jgi:branched-subunit amino acid transport protein